MQLKIIVIEFKTKKAAGDEFYFDFTGCFLLAV